MIPERTTPSTPLLSSSASEADVFYVRIPKVSLIFATAVLMGGGNALAAGLPGGATSLNETYGNWTVACAAPQDAVRCAVSQVQASTETGQRVLAIELTPTDAGNTAAGMLVLPFGLKLDQGAVLSIDERAPLPALRFSTCIPAGCLVPLTLDRDSIAAMRTGTALKVKTAASEGGQELNLSLALSGFSTALARAVQLGGK